MKTGIKMFAAAMVSLLALSQTAAQDMTAFTDVNVLPMDSEAVLEGQTVLIEGDRIVEMGPADEIAVPDGAMVIEGRGRFLLPGLAEMHAHIPGANSSLDSEDILFMYVAGGVTTARGMLGSPNQLELKKRAQENGIVSPSLYLASPPFSGNTVDGAQHARERVDAAKAAGYDLLKMHEGLTRAEYDAITGRASEIGIPFGGHVADSAGLAHALEKGQRTIEHLDNYLEFMGAEDSPVTDAALDRAVAATLEAGAGVVPTQALWEHFGGDTDALLALPELRYMPENLVSRWAEFVRNSGGNADEREIVLANRDRLLKALADGGAEILLGSDAPQIFSVPGFSVHREMAEMADAGLTPYQILRSGTAAPGAYFADFDTFGNVAQGYRADLILLRANPLQDVGNASLIDGVMVRGRWLPASAIDARLEEIAEKHAR